MQTIELSAAEGHLTEIIENLTPGEAIVITRGEKAVATLQASTNSKKMPKFGTLRGTVLNIATDFDDIPDGFEDYLP